MRSGSPVKKTKAARKAKEHCQMDISLPSIPELRPRSLAIRAGAFDKWLGQAAAGERIEYHRGALTIDREPRISTLAERKRQELVRIADRAMALAGEGRVFLLQERRGKDDFSYMAVMAKRKKVAGIAGKRAARRIASPKGM
jgi:hypothetical protein